MCFDEERRNRGRVGASSGGWLRVIEDGWLGRTAPRAPALQRRTRARRLPPRGWRGVAVGAGIVVLAVGVSDMAAAGELERPSLAALAPPTGWELRRNTRPVPSEPNPIGSVLELTDLLEAGPHTWAGVLFPPSLMAYLGPGSKMMVQDLREETDGAVFTALRVAGEAFRAVIDPLLGSQTLRVDAGNVTAVTRDADLLVVETSDGGRELRVFDGRLEALGPDGRRVTIGAGQWVLATPDGRLGPLMEMGPERDRLDRRFRPPEGTQVSTLPAALPERLPRPAEDLPHGPDGGGGGRVGGLEGGDVGGDTGAPPLPPIVGRSVIEVVK